MLEPLEPPDEPLRLKELCALDMLDTPQEERFERITRSAVRMFSVPIALISLVDADRQWFKSRQGLDASQTPRNISFCGHAILTDAPLIVNDATQDERFADNPLVLGDLHLRFYAGYPLHGPHGYRIGTLCLIDKVARKFSTEDIQALADLAGWAETELNSSTLAEAIALARDKQESLLQSNNLLNAVMDGTSAYVHLRDLDGRYLYINKEYERVFGVRQQDVIGKTLKDIFPTEEARFFADAERAVVEHGTTLQTEAVVMMADGPHTYLVARSPLYDEQGRIYGACGVGTDITEGKRSAKALQELNEQLAATTNLHQAILDGCNFSIISTDLDGVIRTFNVGAEHMLGYAAADVVGKQSPGFIHDPSEVAARAQALSTELGYDIAPGFEAFVAKARLGRPDEHEWTYRRKDGSSLPVMLSVTALRDSHNELTGFLGIAYDLTERKRIESMKNEFISTVSHELRTPLTSIRGSIGLLAAGAVGEIPIRAKSLLDIAKNNCERLVRLINDILDIEKIESGNMRFASGVHALRPLLETALGSMQAFANQFQVKFELQMPEQEVLVNVDTDRFTQVMVNLLSNAIKFSPHDGVVTVKVTLLVERVRIAVIDRGEGIPEEFQSRIFRKFAQADSSDTRAKGGTGLGLNISRAIVERMHGQIGFHSKPKGGSEFYFDLPHIVLAAPAGQQRESVLICEDDRDIARLLSIMLEHVGISSDIAGNAAIARQMLSQHHYEAMTLDLDLPGEDGISLLNWLRTQEVGTDLPVVVVSAHADEGKQKMHSQSFGVVDWISKPIDEERLLLAMQKASWLHLMSLPRILHVEADLALQAGIADLLHKNYQVVAVSSLQDARDILSKEQFALILLDLELPDGGGAQLLASLPAPNRETPVVIFSGQEASAQVSAVVKAALLKSHTSDEQLLQTLRKLIVRNRHEKPVENV